MTILWLLIGLVVGLIFGGLLAYAVITRFFSDAFLEILGWK